MKNRKFFDLFYFKFGCLLFWAIWFTLATTTNIFSFLHAHGFMPIDWQFQSGNYDMVKRVVSIYQTPAFILDSLFICITLLEAASALFFWLASYHYFNRKELTFVNLAFMISIAIWAGCIVMEEIFIAYSFESIHIRFFVFECVILMAIHLLPE